MTKGWLIGGIFASLVAVFAGGCGLVFFGMSMSEKMSGKITYGIEFISLLAGVLPGIIAGLIAWWAFKRHREQVADADSDAGRGL